MVKTDYEIIEGKGLDNLAETAKEILAFANNCKIWLFEGDMGAGKTTLIKEITSLWGINEQVASPTFAIVNEYLSEAGSVFHFDFYRIKSLAEAMEVGVEDYFFSGDYCLIEWPEVIMPLLPHNYLEINIEIGEGEERRYKIKHYGID